MPGLEQRLKELIKQSFGKNPIGGSVFYDASKRIDKVRRYHDALNEDNNSDEGSKDWTIDEITWNDLEMNDVFLRVNHTNSFMGEQFLYHRMHNLCTERDMAGLHNSERRIKHLEDNPDFRLEIESKLRCIGKADEGYYLPEFLLNSDLWKIGNTVAYHILQALLILFLSLAFAFDSPYFLVGVAVIGIINMGIYFRCKQKYEVYFTSLIELKKIYDFVKWLLKKDTEKRFITDEASAHIKWLGKMTFVVSGMTGRRQASMTGDVFGIFREYLWGILLIDVSMFNHIMRIIADKQKDVLGLLQFVGEMDSDIAILSYRSSVGQWCEPNFTQNGIKAVKVAHPLISNPVTNDFEIYDRVVITGSNASGKSTFMKSIAINCILAQSINTCIAENFEMKPLMVVTCMALRDDILSGESYYYREAKCLKRMLDLIKRESDVLVVVDEILKGTNTAERIAASKAILEYIAETDCLALVATHDNELTESGMYNNCHFRNEIKDNDIVFDYQIHKGKSTQSNAIALLEHLGYPKEVVESARINLKESRKNENI